MSEPEQLDLFEDLEQDVYVHLTISYEADSHPGIQQQSFFTFVDTAPEFPVQMGLIDAYAGFNLINVSATHLDLPEPITAKITHYPTTRMQ